MAYIFASGSSIRIFGGIFNAVNNTSGGTVTIINHNTVQGWPAGNGDSPGDAATENAASQGTRLRYYLSTVSMDIKKSRQMVQITLQARKNRVSKLGVNIVIVLRCTKQLTTP